MRLRTDAFPAVWHGRRGPRLSASVLTVGVGCGYQESEVWMVVVAACRLAVMLTQTWWRSSSQPSARQPSQYLGPPELRCQP